MSGAKRSAVVIARLLGAEGYSDHVHNQVESYWKNVVMDEGRAKSIEGVERRFSKMVEGLDLTEKERTVLGRFISLRAQMSFDAGLRIGIMALAHVHDKTVEDILTMASTQSTDEKHG